MADEILLKNTPFSFTPINKTIMSYVFVLPTVEISYAYHLLTDICREWERGFVTEKVLQYSITVVT